MRRYGRISWPTVTVRLDRPRRPQHVCGDARRGRARASASTRPGRTSSSPRTAIRTIREVRAPGRGPLRTLALPPPSRIPRG